MESRRRWWWGQGLAPRPVPRKPHGRLLGHTWAQQQQHQHRRAASVAAAVIIQMHCNGCGQAFLNNHGCLCPPLLFSAMHKLCLCRLDQHSLGVCIHIGARRVVCKGLLIDGGCSRNNTPHTNKAAQQRAQQAPNKHTRVSVALPASQPASTHCSVLARLGKRR